MVTWGWRGLKLCTNAEAKPSKAKQPVHFDDDGAISNLREAVWSEGAVRIP